MNVRVNVLLCLTLCSLFFAFVSSVYTQETHLLQLINALD